MDSVLHGTPSGRRPWTSRDQAEAEVAAACGVPISSIARALGRSYGSVQYHLVPSVAKKAVERSRAFNALQPEKVHEYRKQYYLANRDFLSQRGRAWYAANRQKSINAALKWSQDNRERSREIKRRSRIANRAKVLESKRNRYRADPQKVYDQTREWRRLNPAKCREQTRRRKALRRSSRRSALKPLNLQLIKSRFALWGHRCAYCGSSGKMTVDHVLPLTAGGLDEPSNAAPACASCNSSKHTHAVESWYRRQPFFTEARWRKIQRHCPAAVAGQLPLALPA
jgi:5-methylcytosine-specific restriction endonuclease McrA